MRRSKVNPGGHSGSAATGNTSSSAKQSAFVVKQHKPDKTSTAKGGKKDHLTSVRVSNGILCQHSLRGVVHERSFTAVSFSCSILSPHTMRWWSMPLNICKNLFYHLIIAVVNGMYHCDASAHGMGSQFQVFTHIV